MPKIIVSYRRSDSSATAGRIYDRLLTYFGEGSVFMDIDAIPFGTDFRTHIRSELLLSDILLAVIGPHWLGQGTDGTNRIDDEADPVRVEVETALRHGITIVPVLIDGTTMPAAGQLPEPLKDLAFLNAAPVDMGRDFRSHMDRLAKSLDGILAQKRSQTEGLASPRRPAPAGAALLSAGPDRAGPPPAAVGETARPRSRGLLASAAAATVLVVAVLGAAGWKYGENRSTLAPTPAEPRAGVVATEHPTSAPGPVAVAVPEAAPPSTPPPVVAAAPSPAAPAVRLPATEPPPRIEPIVQVRASRPDKRSQAHGSFAWYELWTTNAAAAQNFYRSVIGWDARTSGAGDAAYTMLLAGPVPVAGLATLPANTVAQGARPSWVGYVSVSDVDSSVAQAKELGGTVYRAPTDVAGIGRYALIADPQGAMIVLYKGLVDAPPAATPLTAVGYTGWRELQATDRDGAFRFYAKLFGWAKADGQDVTSAGDQLFTAGAEPIGGVTAKAASVPVPYWTYYFQVDGLTAAIGRVQTAGGTIVVAPHQVRGGSWVAQGIDPQGAIFALMSQKR